MSFIRDVVEEFNEWKYLDDLGETELVVEEVEGIAKVVEKVAIAAEKLSAEVADKLPENGKLKEAALFVEHVSQEAAHDAEIAEHFIHKVSLDSYTLAEYLNLYDESITLYRSY